MKALCHFESIERKTSQLRSLIEALKREVLGLEADITDVETFDRQANPPKSAYPIAARTVKARRDNLVRTILILQGKLNELELVQFQLLSKIGGLSGQAEQAHYE